MTSIVVPVNFSDNSNNAARYAAALAQCVSAELYLVHIFQPPVATAEAPMPQSTYEELQTNALRLLQELASRLKQQTGGNVKISSNLRVGTVEESIEKFCAEVHPSLVIMGATGSSLENVLLGSNTKHAVGHLPYPILVVPEKVQFTPIRKIVMACDKLDLNAGMPLIVPMIRELAGLSQAKITLIYIAADEQSASEFTQAFNRWNERLKGLNPDLILVRGTKVDEEIDEYLSGQDADLVLVFPKKHGWLEFHRSHAKRLIRKSRVPVMSVLE
jgi:nucleotide-binding universal stress UspA family protein